MVCIKDFKMPTSCSDCLLNSAYYCDLTDDRVVGFYNEKHPNCPLVEIKENKDGNV